MPFWSSSSGVDGLPKLLRFMEQVQAITSVRALLTSVDSLVAQELFFPFASLFLWQDNDPQTEVLVRLVQGEVDQTLAVPTRTPVYPAAQAVVQGAPALEQLKGAVRDPYWPQAQQLMAVPLQGQRTWGALVAYREKHAFSDEEVALLQVAAAFVAARLDVLDQAEQAQHRALIRHRQLSILNHETRTALTSMQGFTELLIGQPASQAQRAQVQALQQAQTQLAQGLQESIEGLDQLHYRGPLHFWERDVQEVLSVLAHALGQEDQVPRIIPPGTTLRLRVDLLFLTRAFMFLRDLFPTVPRRLHASVDAATAQLLIEVEGEDEALGQDEEERDWDEEEEAWSQEEADDAAWNEWGAVGDENPNFPDAVRQIIHAHGGRLRLIRLLDLPLKLQVRLPLS